jgi:hypothetical protein
MEQPVERIIVPLAERQDKFAEEIEALSDSEPQDALA